MKQYPIQLPVPTKPGQPPRTAGTPYNLTSLLLDDMKRARHDAAGVVRTPEGRVERRTWPKVNMARFTSATHAFVVTTNPDTWGTGLQLQPDVKALNPDIAATGSDAGLFDIPAGQLPE